MKVASNWQKEENAWALAEELQGTAGFLKENFGYFVIQCPFFPAFFEIYDKILIQGGVSFNRINLC